MATKEIERRIAVIFATDVVGYSKSIEINEEKTIKSLRACKKILEDLFKEHDGRIFNTAGDSVLAEFSSAVSAVICATEFQKLIKERNESETTDLKMEFRIGINMGDVVVEGDNLYGDGVNIAARIEALAQPNGVCISRSVHEFINKKLEFLFNDLGEQTVKENKFHAFDVVIDDSQKRTLKTKSNSRRFLGIVAALAEFREKFAQTKNIPRNRVIKDDALLELASNKPKNLDDLSKSRLLLREARKGELASGLLKAIEKGINIPESDLPEKIDKSDKGFVNSALADLLRVLLKSCSESAGVASKLIASASDLDALAAGDRNLAALQGWRLEVFGKFALDLCNGKIGLSVEGSKVTTIQLSQTS